MIISINEMSEIPIYQQIRNQIVQGISDGRLSPGEQLPTVRGLAEEIGINSMTVNKAYSLLKAGKAISSLTAGAAQGCGRNLQKQKNFRKSQRTVAADHIGSESQRHDEGRIF